MLPREDRTLINNSIVLLQRQANQRQQYKVINISRGGLCFQSKDDFELNEVVDLSLTIDQQTVHKANARVCYRNKASTDEMTNVGLSFLDKFIDNGIIRGASSQQA